MIDLILSSELAWQYTPYALPLLGATLLNLALGVVALSRRRVAGAPAFAVLVAAGAVWSLSYALQLGGLDEPTQILFGNLEYLGIVWVPVATLVFALTYTGRGQWIKPPVLGILAIEPVLTIILLWTMPTHGLVRAAVILDRSGPLPMLIITRGPWFWVHTTYSYGTLLLASAILVDASLRSQQLYRQQAGALLIGVLVPLATNAIYLAHLSPFRGLDLTPYAFTITGVALAWALFRGRLLDLVVGFPLVAGAVIVDRIPDGIILVDGHGTIVEINPVACRIIGRSAKALIGRPVRDILPDWGNWRALTVDNDLTVQTELRRGDGPDRQDYDVVISGQRTGSGRRAGWILVLRDVTDRVRAEEAIRQLREAEVARRVEAARLEGVLLTVRETAHQLNNALAEASGFTELALLQSDPTSRTHDLLHGASEGIESAISYVRNLQRVSRVATKPTPVGPSLDLERSVDDASTSIPNVV